MTQWATRVRAASSLLLLQTSCFGHSKQASRPISSVDFGQFRLTDKLRKIASDIWVLDHSLNFELCAHPRQCPPAYDVANDNGVNVIIHRRDDDHRLFPITERPREASSPRDVPLIAVPPRLISSCCKSGTNWPYMSRLRKTDQAAAILTTSSKWPLVSCDEKQGSCTMGFAVQGAFVEATFALNGSAPLGSVHLPSQPELWALGTAIDEQIRAVSMPSRGGPDLAAERPPAR